MNTSLVGCAFTSVSFADPNTASRNLSVVVTGRYNSPVGDTISDYAPFRLSQFHGATDRAFVLRLIFPLKSGRSQILTNLGRQCVPRCQTTYAMLGHPRLVRRIVLAYVPLLSRIDSRFIPTGSPRYAQNLTAASVMLPEVTARNLRTFLI